MRSRRSATPAGSIARAATSSSSSDARPDVCPAGMEVAMNELSYDEAGSGDPSLLFLHGWCGDRSFFAPQFDYFSGAHKVLSVDLPAHGQSPVPKKYSIEAF